MQHKTKAGARQDLACLEDATWSSTLNCSWSSKLMAKFRRLYSNSCSRRAKSICPVDNACWASSTCSLFGASGAPVRVWLANFMWKVATAVHNNYESETSRFFGFVWMWLVNISFIMLCCGVFVVDQPRDATAAILFLFPYGVYAINSDAAQFGRAQ